MKNINQFKILPSRLSHAVRPVDVLVDLDGDPIDGLTQDNLEMLVFDAAIVLLDGATPFEEQEEESVDLFKKVIVGSCAAGGEYLWPFGEDQWVLMEIIRPLLGRERGKSELQWKQERGEPGLVSDIVVLSATCAQSLTQHSSDALRALQLIEEEESEVERKQTARRDRKKVEGGESESRAVSPTPSTSPTVRLVGVSQRADLISVGLN